MSDKVEAALRRLWDRLHDDEAHELLATIRSENTRLTTAREDAKKQYEESYQREANEADRLHTRITAAEKVVEAFKSEEKAGRYSCECEWAPDEYNTQVRECVTHAALHKYEHDYRAALTDATEQGPTGGSK